MRKKLIKIGIALGVAAIILAIGLTISFSHKSEQVQPSSAKYEITETDIFSLPTVSAKEISVKGVMLGDTQEQVIEKLGNPDKQFSPKPSIINMEYGNQLGLFDIGLIVQLRDGKVRKMALKEPMNALLIGKTKIIHTKEEIYFLVGKPDETLFVPITPTSALVYRLLQYKEKGIEVIIRKDQENGFTITDVFDSN